MNAFDYTDAFLAKARNTSKVFAEPRTLGTVTALLDIALRRLSAEDRKFLEQVMANQLKDA